MAGIKEVKEVLVAVNEAALFLVTRLKDGVGTDDAIAFWDKIRNDEDFKQKMVAAYDNWQAIPGEVADIDFSEALELGKLQLDYVPKFLAAIRG